MALHHEIVKVLDERSLYDSAIDKYFYTTEDGCPLSPGYYLVLWPPRIKAPRYDEHATYYGPFTQTSHVQLLMQHCLQQYLRKIQNTKNRLELEISL
ncbi:MAG TPA: hypothetical protein VM532_07785 [Burkholderiales bacterium]|jgi:hypothetical protein|nr:hypothetical protein [Burkholderiales bacterium]